MVTDSPLACSSFPREAEIMPLPSEEVTPPVTKMYFVEDFEPIEVINRLMANSGSLVG